MYLPGGEIVLRTVPDLLTPAECAAEIAFAEAQGFESAPITTAYGPRHRPDVRNNTRAMVDAPERAAALYARLAPHLPPRLGDWRLVGLNERLRYYRYDPGQRFNWHMDGAFVRGPDERSLLTVMVYLNEGFDGGQTLFHDVAQRAIQPRTGLALLFSHPLEHCGDTVTAGHKLVLRTDAMYRRDPA